eukprot:TRINITY_DN2485_c0_g2_i2.p1 TRINITY_DN2485_c0_g2~~TRINITY_DN2485_c0_g2_i2.p1  ORF type:complete len:371 (+),score=94.38 TRINITY_DN2485_c0_g2_i2:133-1245(+)
MPPAADGGGSAAGPTPAAPHPAAAPTGPQKRGGGRVEHLDPHGFYLPEGVQAVVLNEKKVNRRQRKWDDMAKDWGATERSRPDRVKERVRKGIPPSARKFAWPLLTHSRDVRKRHRDIYRMLLERDGQLAHDIRDQVERDLDRTLPDHAMFREAGTVSGQHVLRNILHAYALFDPDVGYCQGMGFIVAMMITVEMEEEDCFWTFVQLMHGESFAMQRLFLPGFPMMLQFFHVFEGLLERFYPKLSAHFRRHKVSAALYATQWFLTLFVNQFPHHPHLLLRLLDIFMSEGWKIMFRLGLTLLHSREKLLLTLDFDHIMMELKNLHFDQDPDKLLRAALDLNLKHAHVYELCEDYVRRNPDVDTSLLFPKRP